MSNREIIENIKSQLTKDRKKDVAFLQQQLNKYKAEKNEEVIYALSYMIFEYLNPEMKKKFDLQVHEMLEKHQAEYNRANDLINKGMLDEAKSILQGLLTTYDKVNRLEDRKFFDFSQSIEYYLYCGSIEKMRELKIKRIPEPVTYYCYQLATIATELGNEEEAIAYLEKALLFNPVCEYVMQELIDRYQKNNEIDKMFALLKQSLLYSYTKAQLAFCYQKLGSYFQNKGIWDIAVASFTVSDHYVVDPINRQEIKKIVNQQGYIHFNGAEDILSIFKREDINYGPSSNVMKTFAEFVNYAKELKDINTVKYLLTIAYELTDADYFKDQLTDLERIESNDKERKN